MTLTNPEWTGHRWRHRKGGEYEVLVMGLNEVDLSPVVVYQSEDGLVWVRPYAEFHDGRFTCIDGETP